VFSERLRHSGKSGFCGKIGAHMVSHQHGGAFIDDSERLDHMLLLPCGSAGTLEASLKSSCQCCIGAGRSRGSVIVGRREAMRPFSGPESVNSTSRFLEP